MAALKVAMKNLAKKYGCSAAAIQCWNALQDEIGIMPCAANSLLNEEGLPVVCETDIHGAVTAILAEAAGMDETRTFFADWTVRHPDNENGELLQHCGPWPISCLDCNSKRPTIGYPLAFDYPGAVESEAKHGEMTLCRFDGDNGEYSPASGECQRCGRPLHQGNLCLGGSEESQASGGKDCGGALYPSLRGHSQRCGSGALRGLNRYTYSGVTPDLYDDNEEEVRAFIRGE